MGEGVYIISRQEAIAQGLLRYFNGMPCKHGHICERLVSSCDCMICHADLTRNRGRKQINIKRAKERFFKRVYGLTPAEFNDMLWKQGYRCLLCDDKFDNTHAPHLDHNHKTEKIRGILCRHCNTGLGLFRDSVIRLKQAIDYLEKYDGVEQSS